MHAKPDLRVEFEPNGHFFRLGDLCRYLPMKTKAFWLFLSLLALFAVSAVYALLIHKTDQISVGMSFDSTMKSLSRLNGEHYAQAAEGKKPRIGDPRGVTGSGVWILDNPDIALELFFVTDKLESIKVFTLNGERFFPLSESVEKVSRINFPRIRRFYTRTVLY